VCKVEIKTGARVRSAVCNTEVIVVRAAAGTDLDLRCGGQPMLPLTETRDPDAKPDPEFAGGAAMGKRYADEELGLELLVTKAGEGSLSIGTALLGLKDAKPLPSSD
jgi:hypothetical protein